MGSTTWVLLEIYVAFQQWKNFENPLRIDKVIAILYYCFGKQMASLCGGRMLSNTPSLWGPALLVHHCHCQVLHFPPIAFGPSLSGPAVSGSAFLAPLWLPIEPSLLYTCSFQFAFRNSLNCQHSIVCLFSEIGRDGMGTRIWVWMEMGIAVKPT